MADQSCKTNRDTKASLSFVACMLISPATDGLGYLFNSSFFFFFSIEFFSYFLNSGETKIHQIFFHRLLFKYLVYWLQDFAFILCFTKQHMT